MGSYRGPCGTGDAVTASCDPDVTITVKVKNRGRCPLSIEFSKASGAPVPGKTPVDPGQRKTVSKAGVGEVRISCGKDPDAEDDAEDTRPHCRFTYTIDME